MNPAAAAEDEDENQDIADEANALAPESETAPEAEAEAEADNAAGEPSGPGVAARVASGAMAAASFAAARGAGLAYAHPRSALAAALSVVVLGTALLVRPGGRKATVAQIPSPAVEAPDDPIKAEADKDHESETPPAAPAAVADLDDEPAPAIEARPVDDDDHDDGLPPVDGVRLTSGGSALDLPALPDVSAEAAPAPAPTIALAAANLKLGEEPKAPKDDPAPAPAPAPAPVPVSDPAPAPAPTLEDIKEPAPDLAPAPAPALDLAPAPAPDLAPAPAPAIGEDHGLLEMPSLDDQPAAPAVDPAPDVKPEPEPEPEPKPEVKPEPTAPEPPPPTEAPKAAAEPAPSPPADPIPPTAATKPLDNPDQPPAPAVEPPPVQTPPAPAPAAAAAAGGLPDLRAVPAVPAPVPVPVSVPVPVPVPTPSISSMAERTAEPDEPDRQGWAPIKRSSSTAYMLRDLDEPDLDHDDFGPRAPGPNADPDAHADRAMEFEVHQPFQDQPRASSSSSSSVPAAAAADEGRMDTVLHTVRPGENFWTISRTYYTSGRYYRALGRANVDQFQRLEDLYVGAVIRVPPPEDLDPAYIDPPPARADRDQNPLVAETNSQARGSSADGDPDSPGVPIRRAGRSALDLQLPIADPRAERVSDDPSRDGRFLDEPEIPARRNDSRPIHKVRPRETLRTIARDRLGDARRADEILDLNRQVIDDPSRLIVGQVLDLPDDARADRAR